MCDSCEKHWNSLHAQLRNWRYRRSDIPRLMTLVGLQKEEVVHMFQHQAEVLRFEEAEGSIDHIVPRAQLAGKKKKGTNGTDDPTANANPDINFLWSWL